MNDDEKYRAWKDRPMPLNIRPDFAGGVMRRVHREAGQRQLPWNWPGLLELFQRNVAFQFAALAVAAIAGLSRFWLIFYAIFKPLNH
jgi:hypothetical protein